MISSRCSLFSVVFSFRSSSYIEGEKSPQINSSSQENTHYECLACPRQPSQLIRSPANVSPRAPASDISPQAWRCPLASLLQPCLSSAERQGLCSGHLSAALRGKPRAAWPCLSFSLFRSVPGTRPNLETHHGALAFSAPSAWKVLGQDSIWLVLPVSKFQLKCSLRRHFSPPERNESLSLTL